MKVLDFDFLDVTVFSLSSHLLSSLFFFTIKFSQRSIFVFLFLSFFNLEGGVVNIANRADSERNRVGL